MSASAIDLREGDWRTALADVEHVDALISDPPFSARTHKGQTHARKDRAGAADFVSSNGLGYDALTPAQIGEFVAHWSPRVRTWIGLFTSHDLVPAWEDALRAAGRYVFAPLACVIPGMNVRLAGDGPSNWTLPLVVARPIGMPLWGTLPGAYCGIKRERMPKHLRMPGQKPLALMQAIVGDYSRPGDLVCDPFAGSGSTLVAAASLNRRAIGAEVDPARYAMAHERLSASVALPQPESAAGVA